MRFYYSPDWQAFALSAFMHVAEHHIKGSGPKHLDWRDLW